MLISILHWSWSWLTLMICPVYILSDRFDPPNPSKWWLMSGSVLSGWMQRPPRTVALPETQPECQKTSFTVFTWQLFIHICLASSSLHELPRIGSDASIAFTRNMEPLNGRTGLVQLRPAFKDWSASGFASSRQPPHSQGAGCRLQPDVLSRFLLNQIQFSSQPTNLFQKTQSTFRIRTELTVEVYNWFKLTVWSYPAFSPDHKYTPSCERWELTGCTMHSESNLARLLTPNTRVDCLSPGDTTCLSKTPTIQ